MFSNVSLKIIPAYDFLIITKIYSSLILIDGSTSVDSVITSKHISILKIRPWTDKIMQFVWTKKEQVYKKSN